VARLALPTCSAEISATALTTSINLVDRRASARRAHHYARVIREMAADVRRCGRSRRPVLTVRTMQGLQSTLIGWGVPRKNRWGEPVMGAQVSVLVAAARSWPPRSSCPASAALTQRTSRQRSPRFSPIGAAPDSPSGQTYCNPGASIVSFLSHHPADRRARPVLRLRAGERWPSTRQALRSGVQSVAGLWAGRLASVAIPQGKRARGRRGARNQWGPRVRSMAAAIASGTTSSSSRPCRQRGPAPPIRTEFARLLACSGASSASRDRVGRHGRDGCAAYDGPISFLCHGGRNPISAGRQARAAAALSWRTASMSGGVSRPVRAMTAQGRYVSGLRAPRASHLGHCTWV